MLKQLINDYLSDVKMGASLIEKQLGEENNIKDWNNYIPRSGTLSDTINYQFHGIGCLFEFEDYDVDFDFGENWRIDGFDLWRLSLYVEERPSKYLKYNDKSKLKQDFEQAIEQGVIYKSKSVHDNLYYLV